MKPRTEVKVNSEFRNMAYHPEMLGSVTRTLDSFSPVSGKFSSCYVILEEPCSDVQIDDNGNDQGDLVKSFTNSQILANNRTMYDDVRKSTIDNARDNMKFTNQHSRLMNLNDTNNKNSEKVDVISSLSSSRKLSSRYRLSNNADATRTVSNPASIETSLSDDHQEQESVIPNLTDAKSGHLVLILSDQTKKFGFLKSDLPSSVVAKNSRCPVIVKINGKGCDKYAIINSTRRYRVSQSFCVKLKYCHVTQSTSNPSCFTVIIDGDDGKNFTFEARSPDVAKEWIHAFSPCISNANSRRLSLQQSHLNSRQPTRDIPAHLSGETSAVHGSSFFPDSKVPPLLNLTHVPLMPVLSESLDEDDEE